MFEHLEKAAELEPNRETYSLLLKAYQTAGRAAEADLLQEKLDKLIMPAGRRKRILRPRRVVV